MNFNYLNLVESYNNSNIYTPQFYNLILQERFKQTNNQHASDECKNCDSQSNTFETVYDQTRTDQDPQNYILFMKKIQFILQKHYHPSIITNILHEMSLYYDHYGEEMYDVMEYNVNEKLLYKMSSLFNISFLLCVKTSGKTPQLHKIIYDDNNFFLKIMKLHKDPSTPQKQLEVLNSIYKFTELVDLIKPNEPLLINTERNLASHTKKYMILLVEEDKTTKDFSSISVKRMQGSYLFDHFELPSYVYANANLLVGDKLLTANSKKIELKEYLPTVQESNELTIPLKKLILETQIKMSVTDTITSTQDKTINLLQSYTYLTQK